MIQSDFEKFVKYQMKAFGSFDFQRFGHYAASILNFYVGSSLLLLEEKLDAAWFLTTLYNKGMRNRISDEDMREMAAIFSKDPTLDYSVIQPVFD